MPMGAGILIIGALAVMAMAVGGKKSRPTKKLPEPPVEEKKVEPPADDYHDQVIAVLEEYRLPEGYEFPELPMEAWAESLWISDDCQAWAMGVDFKASVLGDVPEEFYEAMVQSTIEDDPVVAKTHPDEWEERMFGEDYEFPYDTPAKRYAVNVIKDLYNGRYAECADLLPDASEHDSWQSYLGAWNDLLETTPYLYSVWHQIYSYALPRMVAVWEESFPEAYQEWVERSIAEEAAEKNLNLEDKTDWAYAKAYPDGPSPLDPEDPEHEPYIEAWIRLQEYIKEILG